MKLPSPFDEFVFPERLGKQLEHFTNRPHSTPPIMCFHGYPGVGKTTFAKAFAKHFAEDVQYKAMNETRVDSKFLNELWMSNHSRLRFEQDQNSTFDVVTILDEFHNLAPKSQDFFKVQLDNLKETDRVIICLNTTATRPVERCLTEPIFSRTYCVDFNLRESEVKQHVEEIAKTYPHLKPNEIRAYLPDMRRIIRENRLREAISEI